MSEHFTGDQKHLDHFLRGFEKKLIYTFMPFVPPWMSTVHLTMMTLLWSALIVYFGSLADSNIHWLWGSSVCIILQHITDMLDGEVGRTRQEGLIKWGFYMDHFLDYVFLCSIVIGYSFLLPASYALLVLLCLAISGGFMVHTLMDFAITSDFKISFNRFGVAELRWLLIALNTVMVFSGRAILVDGFPYIVLVSAVALSIMVYRCQKVYGLIDKNDLRQK